MEETEQHSRLDELMGDTPDPHPFPDLRYTSPMTIEQLLAILYEVELWTGRSLNFKVGMPNAVRRELVVAGWDEERLLTLPGLGEMAWSSAHNRFYLAVRTSLYKDPKAKAAVRALTAKSKRDKPPDLEKYPHPRLLLYVARDEEEVRPAFVGFGSKPIY